MPRQAKPPVPLQEPLPPSDEVGAVRWFKEEVLFASGKFATDPEAGRIWALKAAARHVMALFPNDRAALAPFASLLAMHYSRRRANADPPPRWVPKAYVAAALEALLLIPHADEEIEAGKVLKEVERAGTKLNDKRDPITAATIINLLHTYRAGRADPGAIKTFGQLSHEWNSLFSTGQEAERWRSTVISELRFRLSLLEAERCVQAKAQTTPKSR